MKRTKRNRVSRQREYQKRKRAAGLCWRCGGVAVGALCPKHQAAERERSRRRRGAVKRNANATSYAFGGAA